MGEALSITGQDVIRLMAKKGWTAADLAKRLGCSKQTVYTWRRHDNRNRRIESEFIPVLSELMRWEREYRRRLLSFVSDSTKSLVFWTFLRSVGISHEILIEPRFCRRDVHSKEVGIKEMLYSWEEEPARGKAILGAPGLGKTTFVRMAARALLEDESGLLPVIIPLGLFSSFLNDERGLAVTLEDLLDYVGRILSLCPEHTHDLVSLIRQGCAVLFLDGIDEVAPEHHTEFTSFLDSIFTRVRPARKVIVTGRPLCAADLSLFERLCDIYYIDRFSNAQILKLAQELLTPQAKDAFLTVLADNPSLRRIASIPLTLTIMLTMFRYARAIDFTEAGVLEFLFDFVFGKYKGARSLGGHIVRDCGLHLESPSHIRSTIYYASYKMREICPRTVICSARAFQQHVQAMWREKGFVREQDLREESVALLKYMNQLGIIENLQDPEHPDLPDGQGLKFASDLVLDWLAAAHLVENPNALQEEISKFEMKLGLPLHSTRRRLFYAFELINSQIGDPDRVNQILNDLLEHCRPSRFKPDGPVDSVEALLPLRFLFVVDCMSRGLISSIRLKDAIRTEFRRLFETNNYALLQRALQNRLQILAPGQERLAEYEKDYVNLYAHGDEPRDWTESDKRTILLGRYNQARANRELPDYVEFDDFRRDTRWRYDPHLELLTPELNKLKNIKPGRSAKEERILRRFTFAARFVPLEGEEPERIEDLLRFLLQLAERNKNYGEIYTYMALDSFWHILQHIGRLTSIERDHRLSAIPSTELEADYFKVADRHAYFRQKYCRGEKDGIPDWAFEDLLNDDSAIAHYMIVEHRVLIPSLQGKGDPDACGDYVDTLLKFDPDKSDDSRPGRAEEWGRIAKLCIYLTLMRPLRTNDARLIEALVKIASHSRSEHNQHQNVGPRQLYDYGLFSLWSLYEHDESDPDILAF